MDNSSIIRATTFALLGCLFLTAPTASAQQGQDAVYSAPMAITNSPSFIDASMFATSADTICSAIYKILALSGYSPAVARFLLDRLLAAR